MFFFTIFCCLPRLRRRRSGGTHGRSFLGSTAIGLAHTLPTAIGGGDGDDDKNEGEQDEGQMAEDASLMLLTALRQARLGDK